MLNFVSTKLGTVHNEQIKAQNNPAKLEEIFQELFKYDSYPEEENPVQIRNNKKTEETLEEMIGG